MEDRYLNRDCAKESIEQVLNDGKPESIWLSDGNQSGEELVSKTTDWEMNYECMVYSMPNRSKLISLNNVYIFRTS